MVLPDPVRSAATATPPSNDVDGMAAPAVVVLLVDTAVVVEERVASLHDGSNRPVVSDGLHDRLLVARDPLMRRARNRHSRGAGAGGSAVRSTPVRTFRLSVATPSRHPSRGHVVPTVPDTASFAPTSGCRLAINAVQELLG